VKVEATTIIRPPLSIKTNGGLGPIKMDFVLKIPVQSPTEELLAGCKRGERVYQKQLYELFHGKMLAVCMRYTGSREEAKDILNEGFMKVFTHIHKYQPQHSLESWIRRIMINNAIDNYRKTKKHRNQLDIEECYWHAEEETVTSNLSAQEILGLVQKLSPAYRAVFSLYVLEGYSHKEVAQKLGISEGTSKSNLAKARGKLQKWVLELNDD